MGYPHETRKSHLDWTGRFRLVDGAPARMLSGVPRLWFCMNVRGGIVGGLPQ